MIKNFKPRLYQETILVGCLEKNSLIVLPTGLGKTNIFMMLAAHHLSKIPNSKILLLGPTKPLISQYFKTFEEHFDIDSEKMCILTGEVSPEKRISMFESATIIFSTPQGLENDLMSGRISLKEVSLLGFDEAHRAVGNYSYVWIAKQYLARATRPHIIALTASPGSDLEKITEVCNNLYIANIEARSEDDPDVHPYIHQVKIQWIYVELPTIFRQIIDSLKHCFNNKMSQISSLGYLRDDLRQAGNKRDILTLQAKLQMELSKGNREIELLRTLSILAEALKVQHALELIETQGVGPLTDYLEDIFRQAQTTKTKAVINLSRDVDFRTALVRARNLNESGIEHPKLDELKKIISGIPTDEKIILFCQYRDSIARISSELEKIGLKTKVFVGQAKRKGSGLSQKEQLLVLEEFKGGNFNVLVTSSVGEEGLDIPSVNYVIFYEPIPSAIRTIQRRGRTGRHESGNVIVLVAKGTRDEAYRWSSHHKQNRMKDIIHKLKNKYDVFKTAKHAMKDYADSKISIYADYREKGSLVLKKLIDLGVTVKLEQLEVGDYILSSRVGVEFKTVKDFVDSIVDKRLLSQINNLKKYEKPLIIVEGEENLYTQRNMHPNAINGLISAIIIDYGIPLLRTKDNNETANILFAIAKREQEERPDDYTLHHAKPQTLADQQEYVVSSLPGIGGILSKPLLEHFGSVKKLFNATEDQLKEVALIGDLKARKIRQVIDSEYEKN